MATAVPLRVLDDLAFSLAVQYVPTALAGDAVVLKGLAHLPFHLGAACNGKAKAFPQQGSIFLPEGTVVHTAPAGM